MIQAVIFDCFGVLYSDGKTYLTSLVLAHKRQELQDLYMQSDYGYISGEEFTRHAAVLTGIAPTELERLLGGHYVRNQELLERITVLRRDFKIGLLSNVGNDLIGKLFSADEITQFFDVAVLSSSLGVVKPAREIYEVAANRLGVLPSDCFFVDDIERNVDGAKAAGMNAALFTTNEQFEYDLAKLIGSKNA